MKCKVNSLCLSSSHYRSVSELTDWIFDNVWYEEDSKDSTYSPEITNPEERKSETLRDESLSSALSCVSVQKRIHTNKMLRTLPVCKSSPKHLLAKRQSAGNLSADSLCHSFTLAQGVALSNSWCILGATGKLQCTWNTTLVPVQQCTLCYWYPNTF